MKRLLSITMTVLLAALLMVSCNVETGNIDDSLALITFSAGERETRSLTRTNPQLDPDDFYWTYKATKKDGTGLTTGATATEKAVVDGAKGLGTTVGPFSYGVWEFELFGYADYENGTYKNLAYNGKASITIKAAENALVVTVESKQTEGVKGHLDFPAKGDIKLTGKDINSESVAYSSLIEQITFKRVDITTQSDEIVYNYENTEVKNSLRRKDLNSGSYAVTFTYWQNATLSTDKQTFTLGDGYKVAEETIYVAIADYLTTTIGGDIASNTGSVKISVKNGIVEVTTAPVTIASDKATTIDVGAAPVSKDETKDTTAENAVKTTISIPSGALTGATVSATTTSYTREAVASSKPTFTIEEKTTTGDGTTTTTTEAVVLGGLDIDLYVDNSTEKATDFSGENKALTITTYIATGLNGNQNYTYSETTPTCDIAVKYDGDGADGTVKSYNATTGELVFEVTHLSTYYFVSKSTVVFNTTQSSAYDKLEDAITAASSGDTLTLLKDVTLSQTIDVHKSFTLDLGGKTITSSARVFLIHSGIVTVDNGTITSTISNKDSSAVRVSCEDDNCATTEPIGFVLKAGATINAPTSYGVTAFGKKDATVDIYGKINSANATLAGNGSTDKGYDGKFIINVYEGAELTANGSSDTFDAACGIYQPDGDTVLNIYGGTVTSTNFSAVEVRWGNANISGGKFISNASAYTSGETPDGGGPVTKGAAIAVSPYYGDINVAISGGEFSGKKQLVVINPVNLSADKLTNVKVAVSGSDISSANTIGFVNNGTYYVNRVAAEANDCPITTSVWSGDTIANESGLADNWLTNEEGEEIDFYAYNTPENKQKYLTYKEWFAERFINTGNASFEEDTEGKTATLKIYSADLFASSNLIYMYVKPYLFEHWNGPTLTVQIDVDLDLNGKEWTPVSYTKMGSIGLTFDFNNHKIDNLKITSATGKVGLFADIANVYIKNLTITNAVVSTQNASYVGVVAGEGSATGSITNVTVKDSTVSGYKYVGGIVGMWSSSGKLSDCVVDNVTVKAVYEQVGGIVGYIKSGTLENCKAQNSTVEATTGEGNDVPNNVGGIAGRTKADEGDLTVSNNTVSNTTVKAGTVTAAGAIGYSGSNWVGYISGGEYVNTTDSYQESREGTDTANGKYNYKITADNTWTGKASV